jgi:transposase
MNTVKIQQHVVENQEVFVGLEDSKRTWVVCARSGGMIVQETSMPAIYDGLRNYLRNSFPGCRITVVYEAGFRGFGLHDKLVQDGYKCIVTPPHTVTEEKCNRQKNDRVDSRRLAKNLENRDCGRCHVPDKQLREDRQISRLYEQVKRDITRESNRIRRTIEFHGLDGHFKAGTWTRKDYKAAKKELEGLELSCSLRMTFATYYKLIEALWETKKELIKELKTLAQSDRYKNRAKLLQSVPGIGIMTAIRLLLEWGDVRRFTRKQEFVNFLGLAPREHSSGDREHRGHITRQGCRSVRAWLIESSWVSLRHDPALLAKFTRIASHSGRKKIAIVAVARTLAVRCRALLISGEEYTIGRVA